MKWFRFYTETMHDPKVQQLPAELFRTWVNLLCVASQKGGNLGGDEKALSFVLRMPEAKMRKHIQELKDAGLLEGDGDLRPHNWDGRQYESDTSAVRMRRHRQRHRDSGGDVTVTADVRKSDVPEQNRTEQTQSDAVTFEEFWKIYPKRVDRRHAEKAYRSALKRASHGEILRGLKDYAWSPDPKFIPQAATWLNGDRWRDEKQPNAPDTFQLRPLGVGG